MKNRSSAYTRANPIDANTEQPDITRSEAYVQNIREMLSSESVAGFVLVVVENPPSEASRGSEVHYCPVAGGIVEVLDSFERSVRAIWCRRSLPVEVSEAIMRALTLRLFAYGFASSQQKVPNLLNKESLSPSKTTAANRLISCTQESMFLFPRDATAFMKTQLCMSKHWETPLDGGSHIDHPKAPCRCSSVRSVAGAWQFSGISLSRFVNYWRNHGRTAFHEIPSSAICYFTAHTRSGQASSVAKEVKRPRRSSSDHVEKKDEFRSLESVDGDVTVKEQPSSESPEASDVISSSRRELRKERAALTTSGHAGAQQRRTDSTKMDSVKGARRNRDFQPPNVPASVKPVGWRKRAKTIDSKRTMLTNEERAFTCTKGIAEKCIGRLRREL